VGHDLAAIVPAGVVPGKRLAQPLLHADFEVHHHEHGCLQPVGQVERQRREFECLGRILRKDQHMLGVAVRSVGA
jgi:hypothetical protein